MRGAEAKRIPPMCRILCALRGERVAAGPAAAARVVCMTDVPMRFPDSPLLWRIPQALSAEACDELVRYIESAQPQLASENVGYRNQDRVIRDDVGLARTLFERIAPHLPATIGRLRLKGLNERLRLYRYRPGQQFTPHTDHWYQPDARNITLLTVLFYLNEGFQGGETRFMDQVTDLVVPQTGLAAVFQHKVDHEGCLVRHGVKYAMRADVLYEAPEDIVLTYA